MKRPGAQHHGIAVIAAVIGGSLILFGPALRPTAIAGEEHQHAATPVAQPQELSSWEQQFKEQLEREDAAGGRAGHREQVEQAMKKLMDEIAKGTGNHSTHAGQGPFSDAAMAQQMDKSYFLGPTGVGETVT